MINVYQGTDTEEEYNVVQSGAPYDLDANSVTKVEVYTCNSLAQLAPEAGRTISSEDGDISWVADLLTFKFGRLSLKAGNYQGKVLFYNAANPNGFVVQEIPLKVVC